MSFKTHGRYALTEEEHLERRKQRFLAQTKVDPETGCWNWTGSRSSKDPNAVGRFKVKKNFKTKQWIAPRWAAKYLAGWGIAGLCVCHVCDNPPCVNPDHLFLGTREMNMADMVRKGRGKGSPWYHNKRTGVKGSQHGRAKLTEADIPVIRELLARGILLKDIAPLFNVSPETIGDIKHGRHWTHV
jgi:hypothetical protein